MKPWRKQQSLIYALHPPKIPASGARFTYTFGLGGITVFACLVTVVTGLALTFYYVPTLGEAHSSIVLIDDVASFGAGIRGLHFWGAQLMVIAVTLHLLRIVFTGGYRPPRELNWLIGLALLVITLIWDFSGFVLRWDVDAQWALLIGTNLLREVPVWGEALYRMVVGDILIGSSTLLRFYSWHIFGLTLVGGFGIVYHLWRLRKDGGISRKLPLPGKTFSFLTRDDLFFREFITAVLVTSFLLLTATFFPVPLGDAADLDAGVVSAVRAPWIFLWVQDLLRVLPPVWAGVLLPYLLLLTLALVPFFDRSGPGATVWFARERWKTQAIVAGMAIAILALSIRELWL